MNEEEELVSQLGSAIKLYANDHPFRLYYSHRKRVFKAMIDGMMKAMAQNRDGEVFEIMLERLAIYQEQTKGEFNAGQPESVRGVRQAVHCRSHRGN